jgi:D-methionine transport system substrate-binding protein
MTKKRGKLTTFVLGCIIFFVTGCGSSGGGEVDSSGENVVRSESSLVVATTGFPYEEILGMAAESLAKKDITLVVERIEDPTQIYDKLAAKEVDAAFFQNAQSLENYVLYSAAPLMPVGRVIVKPAGIYSDKAVNLDDMPEGATIAIPNSEAERAKALYALSEAGLISLASNRAVTIEDIASNTKKFQFLEVDEASLPVTMSEVDAIVTSVSQMYDALNAMQTNIDPKTGALYMEDWESIYADVIAIHYDNAENLKIRELYEACSSEAARRFIEENFQYIAIPAF